MEYAAQYDTATLAAWGIGFWVFAIVMHLVTAFPLYKLAVRTNTSNAWLAWIPVANVFTMVMVGGKAWWWALLILLLPIIPLLGGIAAIVLMVIVWMKVAERVGKPSWWGILMIIPLVNIIVLYMLAYAKGGSGMGGGQQPPMSDMGGGPQVGGGQPQF